MVSERDQLLSAQETNFLKIKNEYDKQLDLERLNYAALQREEEHLRFR
jgi:hypothetical protein